MASVGGGPSLAGLSREHILIFRAAVHLWERTKPSALGLVLSHEQQNKQCSGSSDQVLAVQTGRDLTFVQPVNNLT